MNGEFGASSHGGYNPDEPRDSRGRWIASGGAPAFRSSWRHKPLGNSSRTARAAALLRHSFLSLPDRLRRQFASSDPASIESLSELMRLWHSANRLDDELAHATPRDGIDLPAAHNLRAAVTRAAIASTNGDMADASRHLAAATRDVGAHRLAHLLRNAVDQASSISDSLPSQPDDGLSTADDAPPATTSLPDSIPAPGSAVLPPEFYLVPPETRLTPQQLEAVSDRLAYLNLQKYDPNSFIDQVKSAVTGGLSDPSKIISDEERAEQSILLRLYKYNVFTPTPEAERLAGLELSPLGAAAYLLANGLGADQQRQDAALNLGIMLGGMATGLGGVRVDQEALQFLNAQARDGIQIIRGGIRGYVEVVPNSIAKIPFGAGIQPQGNAFEDYREPQIGKDNRLPRNSAGIGFKTFDFNDREIGVATSNKTINTNAPTNVNRRNEIFQTLRRYVDKVADFDKHSFMDYKLDGADISTRVLELAIPATAKPEQLAQIRFAAEYAQQQGVIFKLWVIK